MNINIDTKNIRWHMNKLGLVNFWLYDKEEFYLIDGKIMLRGQNASGKSITTQSFIPFILDGNRSAERLDPFGSRDRKMEYYFLENTDADDVTGYVYLEFVKENEEGLKEYRTIGIGQRAQRGKGMTGFWGFIILDGKRIGIDLELTKDAGNAYIPMSNKELEYALGDKNLIFKSQQDYKENVNKYLFGFSRIDLYDQFISLLIKVRAPKLSKEFKPSRVYEILNESLQTLTDDDLRSMVDAMEKLDEMELRLNDLKKMAADLKVIGNEYARYNRFILGKKGERYLEAGKESVAAAREFKAVVKRIDDNNRELLCSCEELDKISTELNLAKKELEMLDEAKLTKLVKRLSDIENELKDLEDQIKAKKSRIEEKKQNIFKLDRRIKDIEDEIRGKQIEAYSGYRELENLNEEIFFEDHKTLESVFMGKDISIPLDLGKMVKDIKSGLSIYKRKISEGKNLICEYEKQIRAVDDSLMVWDGERRKLEEIGKSLEEILERTDSEKDLILEGWANSEEEYEELCVSEKFFEAVKELIYSYSGEDDRIKYGRLVDGIRDEKRQELDRECNEKEVQKRERLSEKKKLEEELKVLRATKDPVPDRSDKIKKARERLSKEGIKALPLYEALEFCDNLSLKDRARVEQQIRMAGLLDALLVSDIDREKAVEILGEETDALVYVSTGIPTSGSKLFTISEKVTNLGLEKEAGAFLSSISEDKMSEAVCVLSKDGYFRHGALEGFVNSDEEDEPEYIGAESRKKLLMKKISEKENEFEKIGREIEIIDENIKELDSRKVKLSKEYEKSPKADELHKAFVDKVSRERDFAQCEEICKEKEKLYQDAKVRKDRAEHEMNLKCRELPFEKTSKKYQEILEEVEEYASGFDSLKDDLSFIKQKEELLEISKNTIENEESDRDNLIYELKHKENDKKNTVAEKEKIQEILNAPESREMALRVKELNEKISADTKLKEELNAKIAVLNDRIAIDSESIEKLQTEVNEASAKEDRFRAYFVEDYKLGLVRDIGGTPLSSSEEAEDDITWKNIAEAAVSKLRDSDRARAVDEMLSNLLKIFNEHSSSLKLYGADVKQCFSSSEAESELRSRRIIVAKIQGREVQIAEFEKHTLESIESNEQLIQESDRELFEKILSNTLSTRLVERIRESRAWVQDMSELMQNMKTSMGLNFSLRWLPKESENDGMLGAKELERILSRDSELLSAEDAEKIAKHFRGAIKAEKEKALREERSVNYPEMIRDILDYRKWFEFQMRFKRINEDPKELTDRQFNRFSGGEKAMAMYVPLFGAVNAQYRKAELKDHPRLVALDEAFAGVDEKNIDSMFDLVEDLDFDYIMNSQALWGCYPSVKGLRIAELYRPENSQVVTVVTYTWNGKEKRLEG